MVRKKTFYLGSRTSGKKKLESEKIQISLYGIDNCVNMTKEYFMYIHCVSDKVSFSFHRELGRYTYIQSFDVRINDLQ